jgi:choline kinase
MLRKGELFSMGAQNDRKKVDILILAAGKGSRLGNLGKETPKCLMQIAGKTLIEHQIDALKLNHNTGNIYVVLGHQHLEVEAAISNKVDSFILNEDYSSTNMVHSFLCAKNIFSDRDLIVSYGDIVYSPKIASVLSHSQSDYSIVIDKDWLNLWKNRFTDPYSDAESLLIKNENIIEIGNKITETDRVDGQYIGLMKFSPKAISKILKMSNRREAINNKPVETAYFTDLLKQLIIEKENLKPIYTFGEWFEVDTQKDLDLYRSSLKGHKEDIYSIGRADSLT